MSQLGDDSIFTLPNLMDAPKQPLIDVLCNMTDEGP